MSCYVIPVEPSFLDLLADMRSTRIKSAIVDQYLFASQQHRLADDFLIDELYEHKVGLF